MNDERIERALREIGGKRLPASADNAIRALTPSGVSFPASVAIAVCGERMGCLGKRA